MTYAANFHRRDLVFLLLVTLNMTVMLFCLSGMADTRLLIVASLLLFSWAARYGAQDLIWACGFNVFCSIYIDAALNGPWLPPVTATP
jgi:hypothetical protein